MTACQETNSKQCQSVIMMRDWLDFGNQYHTCNMKPTSVAGKSMLGTDAYGTSKNSLMHKTGWSLSKFINRSVGVCKPPKLENIR